MSVYQIDKEIFSKRLSALLEETTETVYSLGERLSLNPSTISRYVNGKMTPKVTTLYAMANIFDVEPLWLMGYDVEKRLPTYSRPVELSDAELLLITNHRAISPSDAEKAREDAAILEAFHKASPEIQEAIRRILKG